MTLAKSLRVDKRRRTYIRLLSEIHHALNTALTEEAKERGLTQQEMADLLAKDKSFVSKKMSGLSNMTLETLADLAFALGRPVKVSLPARRTVVGSNYSTVFPPHPKTAVPSSSPIRDAAGKQIIVVGA